MANPFVHVELHTTNLGNAKTFYSSLFNWKLEDVPMGPTVYTMVQPGEGTGGGMMQDSGSPGGGSSWLAYVVVDDVKASTEKARTLGANVVNEVMEVPGMGWFSVIVDPTGATLGLWQAMKR